MNRRSFLRQTVLSGAAVTTFNGLLAQEKEARILSNSDWNNDSAKAPVKVVVVQQDGNPGEVKNNLRKALGFAEQAIADGADVILFHEEL